MRRLNPKVDFVFKRIFGTEENKDILLAFLNAILHPPDGQDLTEIALLDPHLNPDMVGDKTSILDVRAITAAGIPINIEIQLFNKYNIEKRTLYYWAKLYQEQLEQGQNYRELKKAVTINIVDFNCLETDEFHSVFRVREDRTGQLLTDDLEIHFLELRKLTSQQAMPNERLMKWMMFLQAENEETLEGVAMDEPAIRKAVDVLKFLSQDKETRRLFEMREKALKDEVSMIHGAKEEGEAKGRAEGISQGIAQSKAKIAKNLISLGMDDHLIVQATGLTPAEIDQLKNQPTG
ncbi:Rpn family recombination-promoting nuclease/putative transposase [Brevibacillus dissolubilis]|uniref:Rpn family recombination-promoting nuclease/putative transposase n=1 Tax=Brevibacillus dissolubilis TaxID=1844116 RepID=UPI0011168C7B|nr:Rpn family recombination-promoting nuclease/putative transposase [Brevibacillus dissolubilis]